MTNIYNKTTLVKNGTLIGNWFEEEILREKTGEGRTIPGKHIPKKTMNFEKEIINPHKKDETFGRVMGQKIIPPLTTSSEVYGKFSERENKFKSMGVKEKIFEDFFKAWVNNEQIEKSKLDESIKNIRLYDTTNKDLHMAKSPDYENLGRRHMQSQDNIQIDSKNIDKLFMASHEMSKFPSIIPEAQVNQYADKFIPYYKDKEITYWSMNLDKGNMYRSHTLGQNAFAKSSGFTQPIQNSKAVKQFTGNVANSSTSKNMFFNEYDDQFTEEYRNATLQKNTPIDLFPQVMTKILEVCISKGWMGLRKLRVFLKNLAKRTSDVLDKSNFKYFFINYGIVFTEKEVDFIYSKYDTKRKNEINFNEFLDQFIFYSEERINLVKKFFEQLKTNKEDIYISFKKLEKIVKPDENPEALYNSKTSNEIRSDYLTSWDNLKEDDFVNEENFIKFFADVSVVIENEEIFSACLKSCGMQ